MKLPAFNNPDLLRQGLTHRSAVNERKGQVHNERLEYLGDAVIELVVSEFVFKMFPDSPEGELTAYRTALVRTETLAEVARLLNLPRLVVVSRGERRSGGHLNPSLLADTFEALVGALYLDQGIDSVRNFLAKTLLTDAPARIAQSRSLDTKSRFQELVQAKGFPSPTYRIIGKHGPDHDRVFTAQVSVAGKPFGTGTGKSKQEAEQQAAQASIDLL